MSRDPSHQTWAEVWPLQGIDSLAGRLATLLLGEKSDTVADNFKIPHNFSRRFWFFPDKCSPWDSIHSLFSYLLTLHNKDDGSDYLAVGAGHLIDRGRFQGLKVVIRQYISVCDEQKVPDSWVKIILLRRELYHGQVKICHVEELREPRQTGIWRCSGEMHIVQAGHESAICFLWMIHGTVIIYAYKNFMKQGAIHHFLT